MSYQKYVMVLSGGPILSPELRSLFLLQNMLSPGVKNDSPANSKCLLSKARNAFGVYIDDENSKISSFAEKTLGTKRR